MSRFGNIEIYRPQNTLWHMFADMDRLFDRQTYAYDESETQATPAYSPRANIEETKEAFLVFLDVPGVKKEDLKIDVHGRNLSLTGERKQTSESESQGLRRFECQTGRFSRSFSLPEGVDTSRVEATLSDGVLKVVVPKSEEVKPRSIAVK